MKILFAVKKENEDWQEELITEQSDHIKEARAWAEQNGFDRFRIADIDLTEKPDFASTINI